ncbi:MDR family MFS transporter [Pararobbsia silviterrae]|uniref:DHA2 family efflux MFS transporter permease subunit n=1 Tax=Pararobbsia silviterrae TaxID=1792498 RepID=A0A494Y9T6_9BURK|nr:MDR family MFS transporter [Pararobbsia silviterrae]RKP58895.1 DHA2 family efflux MFS transporter permease subunit [Pararobbsia silviterrae]
MAVHTATPHSHGQVLPFRESLLAILGIAFVTMLVALDQTVVGTALPTIVAELHGFELYAWVATSYLLASVITVPIFGRLGDYFGRKPFVIASIIVFTGASLLCGAANSMLFLVIARGLQGIGGGMLVGTAFASIPDLFPDAHTRLRWQVVMSSAFGIANAVGPSLGGFLTQYYGWRSVFYVNLPIGLLSVVFVWRFLPHLRNSKHEGPIRIDWLGAALIALSLGALQMLVEELPKHGVTTYTSVLGVLAIVAFGALWRWERRAAQPMLPLDMFANRALSTLFLLAVLGGFSLFALLFYAPLLLQGGFGMSPQEAGLVITPLVVCITIGSITNGRIVTRLRNPNLMLYVGFVMIAVACLGVGVATRSTSHAVLFVIMLAGGLGLGFVLPNLTVFGQQAAGREHFGIATALLQSLRMVGGMFGTALTGTVVTHFYRHGVHVALEDANAMQWLAHFGDPQILIDRNAQAALVAELAKAGHNGALLIEQAREALVGGIHLGEVIAAVVAFVAVVCSRRVPPVKLTRTVEPPVVAE